MSNERVMASVKELVEEFLHGDQTAKALAMRHLAGYASALMDTGQFAVAVQVAGITTVLLEHELSGGEV